MTRARKPPKPKRGRPPEGAGGEPRDKPILVRLSASEHAALIELSAAEGRSIADIMRSAALVRAERRRVAG